jgi:6-phosphogluconate dehydrogenase
MKLGMIGLGKMGGNMTERLMKGGHQVVVFDRSPEAIARYVSLGSQGAPDAADMTTKLDSPRIVWIMVPAG